MTAPTDVDRSAPVLATHEISIDAPRALVWQIHTDIGAWPTWQTDISDSAGVSPLAPGTTFDWTTYGVAITSTVYVVEEGSRILWGGTADGITGVHEWTFADMPTGVTVTTTESFSGKPAEVHRVSLKGLIDESMTSWLRQLKSRAESR